MSHREHINTIELTGRLGQTPELHQAKSTTANTGIPYLPLSIATTERFTDREGKIQERTTWHNAVAWDKSAEAIAAAGLKKGDEVSISGTMRINTFEKDGIKNRVVDVDVAEAKLNTDRAPSRNATRLVGTVRAAPELRHVGDNRALTVLSVATKTTSNGRTREDWHNVSLWGRAAEAAREMKPGDLVAINGSLHHRTLNNENGKRLISGITAQRFQVLERAQQLATPSGPAPKKNLGRDL